MTDGNVFQLSQPGTFSDPLTEVLRNGARALLSQAVEAEVAALLNRHADNLTDDGRQRLVRFCRLCAPFEGPRSADPDSLPQGRLDRRFRGGAPRFACKDAGGLSASTVGRLKDAWSDEHARWSRRDLSAKRAPRGSTKRIGSFAAMQELARPEGVDVAGSKTTDFMLESVRALDSQAFSRWFFSKGQCSAKWRHCIS